MEFPIGILHSYLLKQMILLKETEKNKAKTGSALIEYMLKVSETSTEIITSITQ